MGIVHDHRQPGEPAAGPAPLGREEFDVLAAEHRAGAVRFAIGFLRDRHLAEDMVQEGLRRLYEARDRYSLRTLFGPYLVKTVARCCIDLRRGRLAERRRVAALPARGTLRASLGPLVADEPRNP